MSRDLDKIVNVFEVYEEISKGFSFWRTRPWPIAVFAKGGIIIDLGSGSCINGIYAYSLGGKYLVCVDVSYTMGFLSRINILRRKVVGDAIAADMLSLPIKNNSVDRILAIASLHHIPRKLIDRVFSEIVRISIDNALVIITLWSWRQSRFIVPTFINIVLKLLGVVKSLREYKVPWRKGKKIFYRFYHLYTLEEILRLCKKYGLKVLSYGYTGYLRNRSDNIYVIARVIKN